MDDRVALITGGASGIGAALGRALAAQGTMVVLADRQAVGATEVAESIRRQGGRARGVALDVRDRDMFREIAEHTQRREGRIDLFFNNAGIGIGGEIADYDRAAWDDVLDVNVRGVAYGIDAVFPIMRAQRSGHIVNTASMAGLIGMGSMGSYTASKHAVVGLSKALRIEGRRHGVRVSALCPGVIRTPILHGGEYGGHVGRRLTRTNMERLVNRLRPMEPDRFAQLVLEDVEKNEPFIIVPRFWKAAWLLDRLAPRLTARLWDRLYSVALAELDAQERSAPKTVDSKETTKATVPGVRVGR